MFFFYSELFLRNMTENDRNVFRNRLMEVSKDDVIEVCKKYFIPQLEDGKTSRVVFGFMNKTSDSKVFDPSEWDFINSLDFLSENYFKLNEEEEENKN